MGKARKSEVDIIKAICIISIVFAYAGHTLIWSTYFFLFEFYFVAGMAFPLKPFGEFLLNKIKRIYIPFCMANFVAEIICKLLCAYTDYQSVGLSWNYIKNILLFNLQEYVMAPCWYLLPFFAISVIFYFLVKFLKHDMTIFLISFSFLILTLIFRDNLITLVWSNC